MYRRLRCSLPAQMMSFNCDSEAFTADTEPRFLRAQILHDAMPQFRRGRPGSTARVNSYRRIGSNIGSGTRSSIDVFKHVPTGYAVRSLSTMKCYEMPTLKKRVARRPSGGRKESGLVRLRRELNLLRALEGHSPHIVLLEDSFVDVVTDSVWVVFQYAGQPVMQYIPKLEQYSAWVLNDVSLEANLYRPNSLQCAKAIAMLTQDDVIASLWQLLSALEVLQEYNIVHKDIKPEHILLNYPFCAWIAPDGTRQKSAYDHGRIVHVTLCDFSTAEKARKGAIFDALGTAAFAPPEVFGHISPVSGIDGFARDMWSVGVVAYCLLTGRTPMTGFGKMESQLQFMQRMDEMPEPLHVNPRLTQLIDSMLAYNPVKRPSAGQARQTLESIYSSPEFMTEV